MNNEPPSTPAALLQPSRAAGRSWTPAGIFLATLATVFVAEMGVMWLTERYVWGPPLLEVLVDAVGLGIVLVPLLYLLLFRPMVRQLRELEATEGELKRARDELETRVIERTAELRAANQRLREEVEERAWAQKAIQFQASLLEAVEQAVIATDSDGRVLYWNRFAERHYGWDAEEAKGRSIADLLAASVDLGATRRALAQCRAKKTWSGELQVARRDGSTFPAQVICSPIAAGDGSGVGCVYVQMDITDRKEAEEALRSLPNLVLAAQEEERKRVARDLHDSLGQSLTGILYLLEGSMEGTWPQERRQQKKIQETLIPMIKAAIGEVRSISMALRPSSLDDLGLLATIDWLCREFRKVNPGIQVIQQLGMEEAEIPEELKIVIFRLVQEALNNAAKHSGADRLEIALTSDRGEFQLEVRDNGTGVDPRSLAKTQGRKGFGLSFMRERAERSGGIFSFESAPGAGARVLMVWPWDRDILTG